ncbi:hypothetical protein LENED_006409 [Lentinula edodes]|uniref:Uncharacterized protein n=1 Tax=Lentinula edodes TaxID=5353 RepID=A0A1Q3EBX2_LENED|nr:hypothetical protein LENED_006409 [Lentinula edodes]
MVSFPLYLPIRNLQPRHTQLKNILYRIDLECYCIFSPTSIDTTNTTTTSFVIVRRGSRKMRWKRRVLKKGLYVRITAAKACKEVVNRLEVRVTTLASGLRSLSSKLLSSLPSALVAILGGTGLVAARLLTAGHSMLALTFTPPCTNLLSCFPT